LFFCSIIPQCSYLFFFAPFAKPVNSKLQWASLRVQSVPQVGSKGIPGHLSATNRTLVSLFWVMAPHRFKYPKDRTFLNVSPETTHATVLQRAPKDGTVPIQPVNVASPAHQAKHLSKVPLNATIATKAGTATLVRLAFVKIAKQDNSQRSNAVPAVHSVLKGTSKRHQASRSVRI
jgi:hypothetical protein